jgi:hypothetical protein
MEIHQSTALCVWNDANRLQPSTRFQFRPASDFVLPNAVAPRTGTNMRKLWLTEGLRAKFHKVPKPRLLRETHFRMDNPLYLPTKETLLAQVAAGKYRQLDIPSLTSMPWFGVPKPQRSRSCLINLAYKRYRKIFKHLYSEQMFSHHPSFNKTTIFITYLIPIAPNAEESQAPVINTFLKEKKCR